MTRLAVSVLVINGLLLLPLVLRFGLPIHTLLAVEALALAAGFALLPKTRWSRWLAWVAASAVSLALALAVGEAATWRVLARPLNAYLDVHLLPAVMDLLRGNVGVGTSLVVLITAALFAIGVWVGLAVLFVNLRARARRSALAPVVVAVLLAATATAASPTLRSSLPRVEAPLVSLVRDQIAWGLRSHAESARFEARLRGRSEEPVALSGLAGSDFILAFVESYGVSAIVDPRYAPAVLPRLRDLEAAVGAAGLSIASGLLDSPTRGGQSWLAHGSTLSGLWLDSQLRYDLMLRRGVPTLIDDFRRTGHRTAAVMPAITRAWPDGERFGYDEIHWAGNIDYRGPTLNWVSMPDQFTWHWLEEAVRTPASRPVFAEVALISSHAPWTPVLPVLPDWDAIGDGSVFHRWADAGPSPGELWRDHDRVREHFAASLGYALDAASGYVARHVDRGTLLMIIGDHQPAPMITGEAAGAAVPVHVVSGDPALIAPFLARGFVPGAIPDEGVVNGRMDDLRGWLHAMYGPARSTSMAAGTR